MAADRNVKGPDQGVIPPIQLMVPGEGRWTGGRSADIRQPEPLNPPCCWATSTYRIWRQWKCETDLPWVLKIKVLKDVEIVDRAQRCARGRCRSVVNT